MSGDRWLAFARAWLDDGTVERAIEPLVADWSSERQHLAGYRRRLSDARWAGAFAIAVAGEVIRSPKGAGNTGTRHYVATMALASLASIAGMLGFALARGAGVTALDWQGVAGFVVWNLMVFIPLAVMPATMAALGAGATKRRIAGLVLVTTVVLIPLVGWIGPAGERARLDATIRERASRGLETGRSSIDLAMPLPELWAKRHSAELMPRRAAMELNRRAALIAWAASFALLGGVIAARGRGRTLLTGLGWWLATTAVLLAVWFALMTQARAVVPIWSPPWIMVVISLGAAAALSKLPTPTAQEPSPLGAAS